MFWNDTLTPQRPTSSPDVSGGVLLAAVRALRQAELEAAGDPSLEARVMAEFAEIVVLPRLSTR